MTPPGFDCRRPKSESSGRRSYARNRLANRNRRHADVCRFGRDRLRLQTAAGSTGHRIDVLETPRTTPRKHLRLRDRVSIQYSDEAERFTAWRPDGSLVTTGRDCGAVVARTAIAALASRCGTRWCQDTLRARQADCRDLPPRNGADKVGGRSSPPAGTNPAIPPFG